MKHYPYQRNTACRLLVDQSWCGYHAVTLQNRHLRVTVLPEKGGDIIELLHKPSDTDVLFLSPNGLRRDDHADFTLNDGPGAFMDRYPGAWQEILPAGGPPASHGGIGFGQHGEISVLPWRCEVVADTPDEVAIALTVQTVRTPLRLRRVMRLRRDEAVLHLEETLANLSPQRMPVMWGHHPAFGGGFLETGCVLEVAAATIEVPQETAFATQRLAPGTRGPLARVDRGYGRSGESCDHAPARRELGGLFLSDRPARRPLSHIEPAFAIGGRDALGPCGHAPSVVLAGGRRRAGLSLVVADVQHGAGTVHQQSVQLR
jgi:hypothetical protein